MWLLRWLWWCGGGYRGGWAAAAKASAWCSATEISGERDWLRWWLWCGGGGGSGDGGGGGWCGGKRGLGVVIAAVEVVVV